jgi:hypothetical protein
MACCCGSAMCECPSSKPLTYYLTLACTSGPSDYLDGLSGPMNYEDLINCQWRWAEGLVTEICYPNSAVTSSLRPNLFFKNFYAVFYPILVGPDLYMNFTMGTASNQIYRVGDCSLVDSPIRTWTMAMAGSPTILWSEFCSAPSGTVFDIPLTWSSTAPGTYPNSSYIASITD